MDPRWVCTARTSRLEVNRAEQTEITRKDSRAVEWRVEIMVVLREGVEMAEAVSE